MRGEPKITVTCDVCRVSIVTIDAQAATPGYNIADVETERAIRREGWDIDDAGRDVCSVCRPTSPRRPVATRERLITEAAKRFGRRC